MVTVAVKMSMMMTVAGRVVLVMHAMTPIR